MLSAIIALGRQSTNWSVSLHACIFPKPEDTAFLPSCVRPACYPSPPTATWPWQLHTHHYHRDYDSRELSTRASVGDGGGATGHQSSRAAVDKNKDQLDMLLGNLSKLRASQPVSAGESEEDDEYF
eukprot:scaffold37756_cov20-Tisochrysis_lutea.AAC.1